MIKGVIKVDDKMTLDLLNRYKELAYLRRATLRAILDVLEGGSMPPDEKLSQVATLITATGITSWQERPTE